MDSQPHPSLSPADHLHRASASVSRTFQRCISSICSNRFHHAAIHALILLLRFGQVAATATLTLVFGYMVYEHHTHSCEWYSGPNACWRYKYGLVNLKTVPWSYGVVIGTALASFFQLYLLVLFRLRLSSSSRDSFPSRRTLSRTLSPLLSRTDIPILLLYIFAFASLSDHVVPSGILRGARRGTACYQYNRNNPLQEVLLRECVLAQHGYWWCMGVMLAYLVTSIAGGLVWVEERAKKRESERRPKSTITGRKPGPIALEEGEGDAMSLRETEEAEGVEGVRVEGEER